MNLSLLDDVARCGVYRIIPGVEMVDRLGRFQYMEGTNFIEVGGGLGPLSEPRCSLTHEFIDRGALL